MASIKPQHRQKLIEEMDIEELLDLKINYLERELFKLRTLRKVVPLERPK